MFFKPIIYKLTLILPILPMLVWAGIQNPAPNTTEKRLALVIGNSNYLTSPLPNPLNDAQDITAALAHYGFEVMAVLDGDQVAMEEAINAFGLRLREGGVGLFYYSGHGVQHQGNNYLVPIGAIPSIKSPIQLRYKAVNVGYVLSAMQDAGNRLNIVMLDSCRDNPFRGFSRNLNAGLARIDGAEGMLIAYSTAPGKVAYDGDGRNSPYTSSLLELMQIPNLPIELLLKKVRTSVREQTDGAQTPWYEASIDGNFAFNLKISVDKQDNSLNISGNVQHQSVVSQPQPVIHSHSSAATNSTGRGQPLQQQWQAVRKTDSEAVYNRFLRAYPNSAWQEQAIYYRDRAALKTARRQGTVAAYEKFLSTYPDTSWQATAIYERDQLAFQAARSNGTLADFVLRYPNSEWRGQAEYYLQFE